MKQNTTERVIAIAVEILRVDAAVLDPETRFVDDLAACSMDIIEMLSMAELVFGRTIPDDQLGAFSTLADVVEFFDAC